MFKTQDTQKTDVFVRFDVSTLQVFGTPGCPQQLLWNHSFPKPSSCLVSHWISSSWLRSKFATHIGSNIFAPEKWVVVSKRTFLGQKAYFSGNIWFRDGNRFFTVLTYLGHMFFPVELWTEARQESSLERYFQQKIQCPSGEKIAKLPFHLGPSSMALFCENGSLIRPTSRIKHHTPQKCKMEPEKEVPGNHHFQVPFANFGGSLSNPKSLLSTHPWPPRLLQSYLQHLPEQAHDHLRFGNCVPFERWHPLHSFF